MNATSILDSLLKRRIVLNDQIKPANSLYFRYAALGMGIINTFGNLPGMLLPSIVAAMTPTVRKIFSNIALIRMKYVMSSTFLQ